MSAVNKPDVREVEALPRPLLVQPPVQPSRLRVLPAVLLAVDALALLGAASLATFAYYGTLLGGVPFGHGAVPALETVVEIVAVWLPFLAFAGMYTPAQTWGSGEFSRAVRAVAAGTAAYVLLRFTLGVGTPPRLWLVAAWAMATVALVGERLVGRRITSRMHAEGRLLRRTLIVGTNSEAAGVVNALAGRRLDGFMPVGCLASSLKDRLSLDYTAPVVPTLGSARDIVRILLEHEIHTVVVVSSAFDHEVLERIIGELADTDAEVYLSSSLADVLTSRVSVREVAGIPLIALRGISLSPANLFVKRTFDLAVALTIVVVGMPLWLVVAGLIKLTSRGPIFYVQERIGLRGKPFGMYKFRSMVAGADGRLDEVRAAYHISAGPIFKIREDPRVTPIGRWMRRFSVDEFPQLINVIRGEMSLVGPRPPIPDETVYYDDYQWRRLEVVPGMTGLWQVSGRSDLTFEDMVGLDLFYIGNWRLALDLSILARTLPAVLAAKGAW